MTYEERLSEVVVRDLTLEELVATGREATSLVSMPSARYEDGLALEVPDEDGEMRSAFDPTQPRVPAGHPDGGQWTDGGSEYLGGFGEGSKDFPFEDTKEEYSEELEAEFGHRFPEEHMAAVQEKEESEFMERVYGGNGEPTPQQAKRTIEQTIGAHLEQKLERAELEEMANLLGIETVSVRYTDDSRPNEMKSETRLAQEIANKVVAQWAVSSGDTHPWSVLAQEAIRQEFGLEDAEMGHLTKQAQDFGPVSSAVDRAWNQLLLQPGDDEYEAGRVRQRALIMKVLRTHVRAQYEETQRELEKADIDSVDIVRGATLSREDAFEIARTGVATLQPASSFSLSFYTARDFSMTGHPGYGSNGIMLYRADTVIRARIPRRRILSFFKTGYGCLSEREIVVLGGRLKSRIMYWL